MTHPQHAETAKEEDATVEAIATLFRNMEGGGFSPLLIAEVVEAAFSRFIGATIGRCPDFVDEGDLSRSPAITFLMDGEIATDLLRVHQNAIGYQGKRRA